MPKELNIIKQRAHMIERSKLRFHKKFTIQLIALLVGKSVTLNINPSRISGNFSRICNIPLSMPSVLYTPSRAGRKSIHRLSAVLGREHSRRRGLIGLRLCRCSLASRAPGKLWSNVVPLRVFVFFKQHVGKRDAHFGDL